MRGNLKIPHLFSSNPYSMQWRGCSSANVATARALFEGSSVEKRVSGCGSNPPQQSLQVPNGPMNDHSENLQILFSKRTMERSLPPPLQFLQFAGAAEVTAVVPPKKSNSEREETGTRGIFSFHRHSPALSKPPIAQ